MTNSTLPTISLCMIVKNESARLKDCIQSVESIVTEVIVVDTGSEDHTVAIAQSMGAKVFHHPWEGSFSTARNHSLRYATGEWILILDGDEVVDPNSLPLFFDLNYSDHSYDAFSFEIINFTSDLAIKTEAGIINQVRLFRNHPQHCYDGYVHNQLVNLQTKDPLSEALTSIQVLHYGYTPTVWQAQNKDDRILLHEKSIAEQPNNLYIRYNYGNHLKILGRHEEALEQFILAIPPRSLFDGLSNEEKNALPEFIWGTSACFLGAFCANKIAAHDIAISLTEEALYRRPNLIDARLRGAEAYLALNQHQEAIELLRPALVQDHVEVIKQKALYFDAPYRLGRALFLSNQMAQACSLFVSILPHCTDITVFTHLCLTAISLKDPNLWRFARYRGSLIAPDDQDWPIVDQDLARAEQLIKPSKIQANVRLSSVHTRLATSWLNHLQEGLKRLYTVTQHSIHLHDDPYTLQGATITLKIYENYARLLVLDPQGGDQPIYSFPERYLPPELAHPEESAALLIAQLQQLTD